MFVQFRVFSVLFFLSFLTGCVSIPSYVATEEDIKQKLALYDEICPPVFARHNRMVKAINAKVLEFQAFGRFSLAKRLRVRLSTYKASISHMKNMNKIAKDTSRSLPRRWHSANIAAGACSNDANFLKETKRYYVIENMEI